MSLRNVTEFLGVAWKWVVFVVAAFLLMALLKECNRADRAEVEARRAKQDTAIAKAGAIVVQAAKQSELDKKAGQIAALTKDLAALKAAVPGIRVVRVGHFETAPSKAEGLPRPAPMPGEPCPECRFAAGDEGQIVVDSIDLETKDGAQGAFVAAGCERTFPEPRTRFLSGKAYAPLSQVIAAPAAVPEPPGWGGAILAGYGTAGAIGTGQVLTPPLLWRLGLTAAITAGPGTDASRPTFQLQGGIVYR
jgi:hypothetical protein